MEISASTSIAPRTLVLDGVLLSERGEYTFMTRRFTIKRGSATFINSTELNPTLQATGEYEVRQPNREAINIQIVVGGTMRKPNISLTSDAQPPIPQSDLLSYLAFGRSSTSLVQLEGSGLTNGSGGSNVVGAGAALASKQLAGVALGVAADQIAGSARRSRRRCVHDHARRRADRCRQLPRATQFEFGKYIKVAHVRCGQIAARSESAGAARRAGGAPLRRAPRLPSRDRRRYALPAAGADPGAGSERGDDQRVRGASSSGSVAVLTKSAGRVGVASDQPFRSAFDQPSSYPFERDRCRTMFRTGSTSGASSRAHHRLAAVTAT